MKIPSYPKPPKPRDAAKNPRKNRGYVRIGVSKTPNVYGRNRASGDAMLKQKTSSYQAVIILSQNDYLDVAMPGTSPGPG
jgi:hypothetical protein